MTLAINAALLVAGFIMLVKGADRFVAGASGIAARAGVSELVIGLTVVAIGTSAPETAVSVSASLKGSSAIAVGNAVGSNIFNVLVILGITSLVVPLSVDRSTARRELPFMAAVSFVLPALGLDGTIGRVDCAVLWALLVIFFGYMLYTARRRGKGDDASRAEEPPSLARAALMTALGLALIMIGSSVAVDAAVEIARIVGLGERFIGLTIIAFGTSLPELVTSVTAARRGSEGIAIGNIVGSNIFNILLIVGTASLIAPVTFADEFIFDSLVACGAALFLLVCCLLRGRVGRAAGAAMLAAYALYFIVIAAGNAEAAEPAREVVKWDASATYADRSALHDGEAVLYRPEGARFVVAVGAGHGAPAAEELRTLCHPDGSPKVTGGTTQSGATRAIATSRGTTMADGTPESEADLALAFVVRDRLLARGAAVLMLRETNDSRLDNVARTVMANANADLHIALHYDATETDKGMFFASVPDDASYRAMEPVARLWPAHMALGECVIDAARARGVKIWRDGRLELDLTLTSYATIPTLTLEVGDKTSDRSPASLEAIADAVADGIERFMSSAR